MVKTKETRGGSFELHCEVTSLPHQTDSSLGTVRPTLGSALTSTADIIIWLFVILS